jgi:hypothetical protein
MLHPTITAGRQVQVIIIAIASDGATAFPSRLFWLAEISLSQTTFAMRGKSSPADAQYRVGLLNPDQA